MTAKPRRVRGGVRLVAKHLPLNLGWAGRGWMEAVARCVAEHELKEGFDYGRTGQTRGLTFEPGRVLAAVQGRAIRPYRVVLQIETFTDEQWSRVIDALAVQAIFAGKLLSGEVPESIGDLFRSMELALLPAGQGALAAACTAPNERHWCKHSACVALLVAEAIEKDPFLLFTLRGLPGPELLERLRVRRSRSGTEVADGQTGGMVSETVGSILADATVSPPLESVMDQFWEAGPGLAEFETPIRSPEVTHPLLRRLGQSPFTESRFPLVGLLATCYDMISRSAIESPAGGNPPGGEDAESETEHESA